MYRSRLSSQVIGDLNHTPFPNLRCHRVRSLWEWSLRTTLSWDPTINADITAIGSTCSHGVYKKACIAFIVDLLAPKKREVYKLLAEQGIPLLPRASVHFISDPTQRWSVLRSYGNLNYSPFWMSKPAAIMLKNNFLPENIRIEKYIMKSLFSYLIKALSVLPCPNSQYKDPKDTLSHE